MIRWPGFHRPWCSAPRRVRRALLVCVTLAIVGSVPPAAILADGDDGALLTVSIERSAIPLRLDPALASDTSVWTILANTNNGLMAFDRKEGWEGMEVAPDLAEFVRQLDGGRRLVFTLRKDVRFTRLGSVQRDSALIQADDVAASLRRMLAMNSPGAHLYLNLRGADAFVRRGGKGALPGVAFNNDARTVTLTLERADPTFLQALAMPYASVLPKETPAFDQSRSDLPATGPYFIRRYDPNRVIELARARGYAGPLPKGLVDGVQVKFVAKDAALQDIAASDADASLTRFAPADLDPYARRAQRKVTHDPTLFYFFLNTSVRPFNDERVREAVNLAINRQVIADLYENQVLPTWQAIPKVIPGGQKALPGQRPRPNTDRAEQLVRAADAKGAKVVVLGHYRTPSPRVVKYLVAQLREIGLNASQRLVPENRYAQAARSDGVNIGYVLWNAADDLPDPAYIFSRVDGAAANGPGTANFSRFQDDDISRQIERASELPLGARRDQAWADVDAAVVDKLPIIPFANSRRVDLLSDRVQPGTAVIHPILGLIWSRIELR